jgi:hypothetical protein
MLGVLVLAASLLTGSNPAAKCDRHPAQGPRGLPAAVAIHTTCGAFIAKPDGTVGRGRMPTDWPRWAPPASGRIAAGTYTTRADNFISVYRGGRLIWRSSRPYPRTDMLVAGRRALAFSVYEGPTYVADLRRGARERAIFHGEQPLGFTREGLLLTGHAGGGGSQVNVRRLDGSLAHVVAQGVRGYAFDQQSRIVFYISAHNRLMRFDGSSRKVLHALAGGSRWEWPQLLEGGLIAVLSDRRLEVVRRSGEPFGTVTWAGPKRNGFGTTLDGVYAAKAGNAVGLILRVRGSEQRERVLVGVLYPGSRQPVIVYQRRMQVGCGSAGFLAWRGHWLLFPSYDQQLTAIDTRSRRMVELTSVARTLPGRGGPGFKVAFRASWL